jgi:hypothetical protein
MTQFTWILAIVYLISCFAMGFEIFVKFTGERDELWHQEWIIESCWYIIFSLFLLSIMIIMRPNPTSKMLALVEELAEFDSDTNPHHGTQGNYSNQYPNNRIVKNGEPDTHDN